MATVPQTRKIRMNGAIQSVDVEHRRLKMDVYGIEKQLEVPVECRIARYHAEGLLGDLRKNEWVHVDCSCDRGLLRARSIEVFPSSP